MKQLFVSYIIKVMKLVLNTKHIALRYNMIREFIQEGLIIVKHLSTDLMTVDTLTKALSGPAFVRHQIRLLNLSPPSSSFFSLHRAYVESTDTAFYSVEYFIRHSVLYLFWCF